MLVDSHTHLDGSEFEEDVDLVIKRSNLDFILNVAIDIKSLKKSLELAKKYSFIYVSAGIHPNNSNEEDFEQFRGMLDNPKIKAIGETGLDYYRDYSPVDIQKDVFEKCLKEAENRKLPVVIHQRNAEKDTLDIIRKCGVVGVMHCFSGSIEFAEKCLELGFYISFAGNITYPKANELRNVAKNVPIDRILIETDCPWLAPQVHRGKRNEPGYVEHVAFEIAKIKQMSFEEVGAITTNNFKRIFSI